MRFYTQQHKHLCGIDLHARSLYLCILNQAGKVLVHRKMTCDRDELLKTLKPYRRDLVVAVNGKTKNDRIDSHKIAALLRDGNLPFADVYPREMRPTPDLLRRRLFFARKRAELLAHIQNTNTQDIPFPRARRLTDRGRRPRVALLNGTA